MNFINYVKKVIATSLYHCGLVSRIQRHNEHDSIILGYHRVLPHDSDYISYIQPGMYVTVETFEKHMAYISKNYQVIGLGDIKDLPAPNKTCIITFDDGWSDNFKYAFPIFKKYTLPATIFLTTNMIGTSQLPWPDRMSFYIHNTNIKEIINIMRTSTRNQVGDFVKHNRNKMNTVENVLDYMKKLDQSTLSSLMKEIDYALSSKLDVLNDKRPWLTWSEIIEMSQMNITFGAHSHNHVILTQVSYKDAKVEIASSLDTLTRMLGAQVLSFSYPNGSYNEAIVHLLRQQGFTHAVTTRTGTIDESVNLLTLNRILMHEDMTSTIPMLACKLARRVPFYSFL